MSDDQGVGGSGRAQAGGATGDRPAGTVLEPHVQEYLDAYLERRRTRLSVGGASAVVAAVVALGGFLYFVYDAVQRTAESAAIKAVKSEDVRSIIDEHRTAARTAATEAIKTASEVVAKGESALDAVGKAQKKLDLATNSALKQVGEAVSIVQGVVNKANTQASDALSVAEEAKSDAENAANEIEENKNIVNKASEEVASALEEFKVTLAQAKEVQSDISRLGGLAQIRKELENIGQDQEGVILLVEQKIEFELSKIFESLSGSVFVFDKSTGCPTGWSEFQEGAGRTIIGVGQGQNLSRQQYRTLGGKEKHTLTINEIPQHSHQVRAATFANDAPQRFPATGAFGVAQQTIVSANAGGGQPHSNMPPYIALYFCKKVG